MKQAVKESARSAEVRAELREQGYKIMWDVQQDWTRVSYATNGAGKAVLLLEHARHCTSTRTRVNENNDTELEVGALRHQRYS